MARARIYRPCKTATQSGRNASVTRGHEWVLEYPRSAVVKPDPLMGWQSSADTARQVTQALRAVCSDKGTGNNAMLDYYPVAGKTGTADKAVNGHYTHGKNVASFIGYLPASKPELVISVIVNEPNGGGSGGRCAAPCFREIAETAANYLNLQPDLMGIDKPLLTRLRRPEAQPYITVVNR